MEKLKIRKRKQYEKEIHAAMMKTTGILMHHLGQNYLRFANEILKINEKYFDIVEDEK